MEFNENFDPNEEINFDEPNNSFDDSSSADMLEEVDSMDAMDDLDMGYMGNTEKTKKITIWSMIAVAGALVIAFALIGGLYLSQKKNNTAVKEWVAEYLEKNLADSGLSDEEISDIAERVTPIFFDEWGEEVDLSNLPEDQMQALIEKMKDPLKQYITSDASDLISEDMVKQYIDKEYGDVSDMASRIKELETTQNSIERNVTTLKETAAKGAQGEKGQKGDTGAQGQAGVQGQTGAQGPQGAQGPAGATGAKGEKGDTGAAGAKGDKGDTGAAGTGATVSKDVTTGVTTITAGNGTVATVKDGTNGADGLDGTSTYIVYASKKDSPQKTDIKTSMDATHKFMGSFTSSDILETDAEIIEAAVTKVVSWNEMLAGSMAYDPVNNVLTISQ